MVILNDIELIKCLRPLNLLKNGEFLISNIFMSKSYLEPVERQSLIELSNEGKIIIFESGEDFYNFFHAHNSESFSIGIAAMSSIYYSKFNNMPLVSKCPAVKRFADDQNVLVYDFNEALRFLNTGENHINYINMMLDMI
jgi:hypothetical protein